MSTVFSWNVCFALAGLAFSLSGCGLQDLKEDLDMVTENYGYLKASVAGTDDGTDILVALLRDDADGETIANARSVAPGEEFYVLVPRGVYTLVAFSDTSGDFKYQAGEPAARIPNTVINWFEDMEGQKRVEYDTLEVQSVELSTAIRLDPDLDLSLAGLRVGSKAARNFLDVVTWDHAAFSAVNVELGIWQPGAFQEQVGFGLYVLEEFDAAKKSIVLVHGINDSPRIFMSMVDAIPDDYQVLLFHYPSSFPLEYTSYIFTEALDELIRRHELPQIDVMAHSMGGLVSKGMIYQADEKLRDRISTFVTVASPFGGHSAAALGITWAPVTAPVWWAMAPGSTYLKTIDSVDLTHGPKHHLIYSYSHERGGEREEDDGVVTVESQLIESARRNATAVYGIADSHTGVIDNPCTLGLLQSILKDGVTAVAMSEC